MRNKIFLLFSLFVGLLLLAGLPAQAEMGSDEDNKAAEAVASLSEREIKGIFAAAEAGLPEAQLALGVLYLEGHQHLPKNTEKAVKWFKTAADNNSVEAAALLGALYVSGEELEENFDQACVYLEIAARKGHPASQYLYAMLCAFGLGREADIDEARIWMNASAENGDRDAQEFLRENPEWIK